MTVRVLLAAASNILAGDKAVESPGPEAAAVGELSVQSQNRAAAAVATDSSEGHGGAQRAERERAASRRRTVPRKQSRRRLARARSARELAEEAELERRAALEAEKQRREQAMVQMRLRRARVSKAKRTKSRKWVSPYLRDKLPDRPECHKSTPGPGDYTTSAAVARPAKCSSLFGRDKVTRDQDARRADVERPLVRWNSAWQLQVPGPGELVGHDHSVGRQPLSRHASAPALSFSRTKSDRHLPVRRFTRVHVADFEGSVIEDDPDHFIDELEHEAEAALKRTASLRRGSSARLRRKGSKKGSIKGLSSPAIAQWPGGQTGGASAADASAAAATESRASGDASDAPDDAVRVKGAASVKSGEGESGDEYGLKLGEVLDEVVASDSEGDKAPRRRGGTQRTARPTTPVTAASITSGSAPSTKLAVGLLRPKSASSIRSRRVRARRGSAEIVVTRRGITQSVMRSPGPGDYNPPTVSRGVADVGFKPKPGKMGQGSRVTMIGQHQLVPPSEDWVDQHRYAPEATEGVGRNKVAAVHENEPRYSFSRSSTGREAPPSSRPKSARLGRVRSRRRLRSSSGGSGSGSGSGGEGRAIPDGGALAGHAAAPEPSSAAPAPSSDAASTKGLLRRKSSKKVGAKSSSSRSLRIAVDDGAEASEGGGLMRTYSSVGQQKLSRYRSEPRCANFSQVSRATAAAVSSPGRSGASVFQSREMSAVGPGSYDVASSFEASSSTRHSAHASFSSGARNL